MPTELQFSYGKWPSSGGNGVDDIEILSNVECQYNFKIRRHSRMSRQPTNIVRNDMIVASVDIVSTREETISNNIKTNSNTRQISINNLQQGSSDDNVSSTKVLGTISSSGGGGPKFSYDAAISFPLTSYKCKYCPAGPDGPQFEVRNGSEDATDVCATIRGTSKPFDDKPSMQIIILDDNVDQIIMLCIAADILNEKQVFGQNAKQNEVLGDCFECCCEIGCCLMS